jgi:hypothetical protein
VPTYRYCLNLIPFLYLTQPPHFTSLQIPSFHAISDVSSTTTNFPSFSHQREEKKLDLGLIVLREPPTCLSPSLPPKEIIAQGISKQTLLLG